MGSGVIQMGSDFGKMTPRGLGAFLKGIVDLPRPKNIKKSPKVCLNSPRSPEQACSIDFERTGSPEQACRRRKLRAARALPKPPSANVNLHKSRHQPIGVRAFFNFFGPREVKNPF